MKNGLRKFQKISIAHLPIGDFFVSNVAPEDSNGRNIFLPGTSIGTVNKFYSAAYELVPFHPYLVPFCSYLVPVFWLIILNLSRRFAKTFPAFALVYAALK